MGLLKKKDRSRPKIGVVVGSGGIKGVASIALFEFLEEAEVDVDLLIGCSGGSVFSGLWAVGNKALQMRDIAKKLWTKKLFGKLDYRSLLNIAGLPYGRFNKSNGLLKPDALQKTYEEVYGSTMIEDLPVRSMFQTTDVLTGESVMLSKGLMRDAIYASSAVFPLMPALKIDKRWLIDGIYSSPLPVLEAVNESMDVIIAMNFEEQSEQESNGFVSYFMRSVAHSHKWLQRHQATLSIDLHHHEIIFINVVFDESLGFQSVEKIPEILEAGEAAIDEQKKQILSAIKNFNVKN